MVYLDMTNEEKLAVKISKHLLRFGKVNLELLAVALVNESDLGGHYQIKDIGVRLNQGIVLGPK